MDLNILWFLLIGVLFIGYFFLEGFDYGVGVLLPFLGKNDQERRVLINTIGPFWDGNEVWLLTAGGAIFAAFPNWYATLFSGFYMALFLMLLALIVRGVAFEFRSQDERPAWRNFWDIMIFVGSLIPALLWGVAITNLLRGVPIAANMQYTGSFWTLLSPYTLVGGLATLLIFTLHGAIFLTLKTEGQQLAGARRAASVLSILAALALLLLIILSYSNTDLFTKLGAGIVFWAALVTLLLACWLIRAGKSGWAFVMNGLTIVFATVAIFWGLFPRVMVSSLNPLWSLTVSNASSSPYTLKVMTIVALTLVPVVLLYQAWTYWVFRKRVTVKDLKY
ncbi:MAG: cytochrome d ubiquinol oxidase subunit II [Firmicutes bacterium]|nr:cytochrome d ubiquinol oxidase subunit II [Bacillota bacterium]